MPDNPTGGISHVSSGGVAGVHSVPVPQPLLVGPTTEDQQNLANLPLVAVACWAIDDLRFAFDSSFLNVDYDGNETPPEDIRFELNHLSQLVGPGAPYEGCPLSLFGHADPVGTDIYNKSLSERRARSVYALLIYKTDKQTATDYWKQLSSQENWGASQQKVMQAFVGQDSSGNLIDAYLKKLSEAGPSLSASDFIGQAAGPDRKADFQGCSEFNPLIIFSQESQATFDNAKANNDQSGIEERNARNAPNRRVLALIFKKGTKVDPSKWPCPRASDGIGGCTKRFWVAGADKPDGDTRRSTHLPGVDRIFEKTHDTFACRFYQRLTDTSPCNVVDRPPNPCEKKTFPSQLVKFNAPEVMSGAPPAEAAWNASMTLKVKFSVQVTRDPCSIKATVKVKVVGTVTDAQKAAWKSAIETKWNGKMTLYCSDPKCLRSCRDGYPVTCVLEYVTSGEDAVVNASANPKMVNEENWATGDTVQVTHEFGHLMGNLDEYFIVNGTDWRTTVNGVQYNYNSPTGSVMNNPSNDPQPRHYDTIRIYAGKAMGISCYFDKPQLGDYPAPPSDNVPV